jgi:UDP-N-acetylglucosamine 1-carboxyvinyltransferase
MEHLEIEGGRRLTGKITVEGAKNAALPACVATLLTDDPVTLHSVPQLRDVNTILATITSLGKRVTRSKDTVKIASGDILRTHAEANYVKQMRASFLVLGPLVARLGHAIVPLPGGCTIGPRPVNLHLEGLRQLGATIDERKDSVVVSAEHLRGAQIDLAYPSVGATEQLLMTATLAKGETRINNPAKEPEVVDLIDLLRKMGAQIDLRPTAIHVAGTGRLHGAQHTVIPDRLEAGTYLLAAAITGGEVSVQGVIPDHIRSLLTVLQKAGMTLSEGTDAITLANQERPVPLEVATAPYPGFPTDLQPPLVASLSLGKGESLVEETVFPHRFAYVPALTSMGARIEAATGTARITGMSTLQGAPVNASDIRAGAALVLAGLAAQGHTTIHQLEHIDRGYARFEEKLSHLGAQIERIQ